MQHSQSSLKDSSISILFISESSAEKKIFYPHTRHANDLSGKVEEMAGDIQYLMQAFTGIEDRLSKIENADGQPSVVRASDNDSDTCSKVLQQQMNILIDLLISEGSSRQTGFKQIESNAFTKGKTSDEVSDKVLTLLKNTQKKVNSLENEIVKVEAENVHQGQVSQTVKHPFKVF